MAAPTERRQANVLDWRQEYLASIRDVEQQHPINRELIAACEFADQPTPPFFAQAQKKKKKKKKSSTTLG